MRGTVSNKYGLAVSLEAACQRRRIKKSWISNSSPELQQDVDSMMP